MIYKKYWGTHGDPILPKEKYGEPNVRLSHIKSNILAFKITVSTRFFAKFWGLCTTFVLIHAFVLPKMGSRQRTINRPEGATAYSPG